MTKMTILIVAKNGTCRVVPDFPVEGHILCFCYCYYCYNKFIIVRVLSRNLFGKGWEEFGHICHP